MFGRSQLFRHRLIRRLTAGGMVLGLAAGLVACQAIGPAPGTGTSPIPAQTGSAQGTLRFASRNDSQVISDVGALASPAVVFAAGSQTVAGTVVMAGKSAKVSRPLDAPLQGEVKLTDGARPIATYAYNTNGAVVDLQVSANGFKAPFQLRPLESGPKAGDRTLRATVGTTLELSVADDPTVLAKIPLDASGTVGTVAGRAIGGPATVRLDPVSVSFDPGPVKAAVQVYPFETGAASGTRIVAVLPGGKPARLQWADRQVLIDGIQIAADGTVRGPDGALAADAKAIRPLVQVYQFDAGAAQVAWRLAHYEADLTSGSRSIATFAGDRQWALAIGTDNQMTPVFAPQTTLPAYLQREGNHLTFRFVPVTFDPGGLTIPYQLFPLETGFWPGRRVVYLLSGFSAAYVTLGLNMTPVGSFQAGADGRVTASGGGLTVADGTVSLRTLPVQITALGAVVPFQVTPFESEPKIGSRQVLMVPGASGQIRTTAVDFTFQVGSDGTIVSGHPKVSGGQQAMTVNF